MEEEIAEIKWDIIGVILLAILELADLLPQVQELRLSLADVATSYSNYEPEGPGTYAFGYELDNPETQNVQFRDEERKADGTVTGKYGWVAEDGTAYVVTYVADSRGYRANVENIPSWRLK
ncbi:unnamed protein product [Ceutorhynchus assimilis]|uniref:Uncharacterized protein n=1 Tax=Ceutorhynchus assimilis TaxID=467358 RepID=A0A9N9MYX5_9CUCU|nr:unnamed protein product [Ceutorhynchus assimilis]